MKILHIRNACMIIHHQEHRILVDPCLNPKASLPPYTLFRKRPRLNPLVDLPPNSSPALGQITAGLITHCRFGHFDHLDGSGISLLAAAQVPVYCSSLDGPCLKRRGIRAVPLQPGERSPFLTGHVTPFPTSHGYGLLGRLMGPGVGYLVGLPGEKSLYISGDTVMTDTVRRVLEDLRPDIAVLNAGTAALDLGRPILMPLEEQLEFIRRAPGLVIAVHLEAFNHCLTTRDTLREALAGEGLSHKVIIPLDGELMEL